MRRLAPVYRRPPYALTAMGAALLLRQPRYGKTLDESLEQLKRETNGHLPKRQAQELAVKLAQDFDGFYARPLAARPEAAEGERILVITVDGKGIVRHPGGLREATRRASGGA
jgi:hypothetical protein